MREYDRVSHFWSRRTVASAAILFLLSALLLVHLRHRRGLEVEAERWASRKITKLGEFGETRSLSILPLVNWHAANDGLRTESGVSYLLRTDKNVLLFDFGFNRNRESPSPLEANMKNLGIELAEIDTLFLSHHHLDHSGGANWVDEKTFSLGARQVPLDGKRVYAPIPLAYPGIRVTTVDGPISLGNGLASIGPIRRQLALGPIDEQALAIKVAGRGIVLLVGCGHQKLSRIIERTQEIFAEPIYGVIGDLHYPVPDGRLNLLGINLQRRLASGEGPFDPITRTDIDRDLDLLGSLDLGVIALGGHDTSDDIIAEVERIFGASARRVRVGDWIEIAN